LVDLIFVLQRGETVLSQADHGLFLTSSDEAKRCQHRTSLELLLLQAQSAVAPLIIIVSEYLPLLLATGLIHLIIDELQGLEPLRVHVDLVAEMLGP
jgi:hypothetical protein